MEKQYPPPYESGTENAAYNTHQAPSQHMGGPGPYQPHPQGPPPSQQHGYGPNAPPPSQQHGYPYGQPPVQPVLQPVYMQPMAAQQTQSSVSTTVNVNAGPTMLGGCPMCHNNSWTGTYDCCAWLWLICCFPCGIICCCCMRKKKCTQCGFTSG